MIKRNLVRGVRKSAHLSRKVLSYGANYSGRVENKAHRIINGIDDTIKIQDHIQFEKLYYESIPYITPVHPALPHPGRKPRTVLLIPTLQKSSFFGGTATSLIFAAITANRTGTELHIIETLRHARNTKLSPDAIADFFKDNDIAVPQITLGDISPRRFNHYGYIDLHPDDIFVCSAWWDAYLIERLPLIKKFIYLIQDFEPIFYSNSDMYLMAESTYKSERFIPVCNTELMLDFMKSKDYTYIKNNGLFFEPAVNVGKRIGQRAESGDTSTKTLFIYGRPAVERNLFYTALRTLDELFTEQSLTPSEWTCYMAGQDGISNILLESGKEVKNLGKMSTDEYYEFAKNVDVAVSLMLAPHPSYPPLELASLGASVVTNKYETKTDLSRYSKNIHVTDPSVEAVKAAVLKAAKFPREERLANARATTLEADWKKSLDSVIDKAVSKL